MNIIGMVVAWTALAIVFYWAAYTSGEAHALEPNLVVACTFGIVLAIMQWTVLRSHYHRAVHWIWIMALACGVGIYLMLPLYRTFLGTTDGAMVLAFVISSMIVATAPTLCLPVCVRLMLPRGLS